MLQKIESFIREFHMIEAGDHIIAGVSGGADSVCMFLVLYELRERLGFTMSVLHVEHGIRGIESKEDASFVERLCSVYAIYFQMIRCNVPAYAKEQGMGEEEAGRKLRYQAYDREKETWEAAHRNTRVRIAVAHNQNDNAETMLFHLARGTGIRGLTGISPVRGDIIRPLLRTDREEIENFLHDRNQTYCIDRTNLEEKYSRNRIRHQVLPGLKKLNLKAVDHMAWTALELREIHAYLEKQTQLAEVRCVQWEESCGEKQQAVVLWESYSQLDSAIQSRLLYSVMEQLGKGRKNLTREAVLLLGQLFELQTGRQIYLSHGILAKRVYEGVCISKKEYVEINQNKMQKEQLPMEISFLESGKILEFGPFQMELSDDGIESFEEISKKKYTKCFDYDKIKNSVCIRNRLPGDYLVVDDTGHRQKLKNYLVNEKIPSSERDSLYLLADGAHIIWIVGYRISSYYKVSAQTRRILKVTFYGGKENG